MKNKQKNNGGFFTLFMKQIISASLCFMIIIGMKSCPIQRLNDCASAFGRALRFDADWQNKAVQTVEKVKNRFGNSDTIFR